MRLSIAGIQRAQRANLQLIQALRPSGALGQAVQLVTTEIFRYVLIITHVDTGALKNSHRITPYGPLRMQIAIDPRAPGVRRSGGRRRATATYTKPAIYGPYEHARGSSHAFYERAYIERGLSVASRALALIYGKLP